MNSIIKNVIVPSKYSDGDPVDIIFSHYEKPSDRIAIQAVRSSDGVPEFTATVNIPEVDIPKGYVLLKGWAENEGIPEGLEILGIVGPAVGSTSTGHCNATLHKLLRTE